MRDEEPTATGQGVGAAARAHGARVPPTAPGPRWAVKAPSSERVYELPEIVDRGGLDELTRGGLPSLSRER